jgi:hypothetical protein
MFVITKRFTKIYQGERSRIKVVKIIGFWTLLIMLSLFNGCIASYFSEAVTIGKDCTQIETVGIISYQGFPIWFHKTAPGISAMTSWYPARVYANWCAWTTVFLLVCCSLCFIKVKCKSMLLLGVFLCTGRAGIMTFLLYTEEDHTVSPIRAPFRAIEKAVQAYVASHNGKLPDSLEELVQPSNGELQLLEAKNLIDPWERPIEYERRGKKFTIRSSGPDRIMRTDDDFTN